MPRDISLATRVLLAQLVVLLVALVPLGFAAVDHARSAERRRAVDVAEATSLSLASSPWVLEAVAGPDPATELREPVERLRAETGVDFIVVMAPDGTRYTHPDPDQVGGIFIGSRDGALAGELTVEDAVGTLGPSVRVVAPITDDDGVVVALVSPGVTLREVSARVREAVTRLLLVGAAGLAAAVAGAWLLARSVRRQTFGLGAVGLARLHSYHEALLASVRTGIVLVDNDGSVVLVNDRARELLDLPEVAAGVAVADLGEHGLDPDLVDLLASGRRARAEQFAVANRILVVTQTDAVDEGRRLGWVATLADRTALARASGELDTLRTMTEALRARSHEADNRLHTMAMLVELGRPEEALEFAASTARTSQALTDDVVDRVSDSTLAALVLGKASQAAERGVRLDVGELDVPPGLVPGSELVTIVGNLLDNAVDAAATGSTPREVHLDGGLDGGDLVLRVRDTGPGVPAELRRRIFERGFSTKEAGAERIHGRGIGLSLVQATARRCGGQVTLAPGPGTCFEVRLPVLAQEVRS